MNFLPLALVYVSMFRWPLTQCVFLCSACADYTASAWWETLGSFLSVNSQDIRQSTVCLYKSDMNMLHILSLIHKCYPFFGLGTHKHTLFHVKTKSAKFLFPNADNNLHLKKNTVLNNLNETRPNIRYCYQIVLSLLSIETTTLSLVWQNFIGHTFSRFT